LTSILSLIDLNHPHVEPTKGKKAHQYEPHPLRLTRSTLIGDAPTASIPGEDVGEGFIRELALARAIDDGGLFERVYHLMEKYGWALPCTYGQPGVSLFDQWRAIAALVIASGDGWMEGPDSTLSLIGGDLPGIQDFVYTITSKGAAKGLRGRSFFVQLLTDAIVQRILSAFHLSHANVVYQAGGNFMILGPDLKRTIDGEPVEEKLEALEKSVDETLLHHFLGDLAICLAWEALSTINVATNAFTTASSAALKQKIAQQKRRRFSGVARTHWAQLFGAQGKRGNRSCIVCRRPLSQEDVRAENSAGTDLVTSDQVYMCPVCADFRKLAEAIGRKHVDRLTLTKAAPASGTVWQQILYEIGGVTYRFDVPHTNDRSDRVYLLNDTTFIEAHAHGFRFVANTTPRVIQADVDSWLAKYGQSQIDDLDENDQRPQIDHIRSFSQMADVARGVKRLGVLRMDVDSLGAVIVRGLPTPNLTAIMALSRMLTLFFSGWLNEICRELNQRQHGDPDAQELGDRLYVIYAGGDDLFVVGSWDLMPELAQRVHDDFTAYTGHNPSLTISGGITLEGRKFPLYQAAEEAGEAEEAAKRYTRNGKSKDAITFLTHPLQWEEWRQVTQSKARLLRLMKPEETEKQAAPSALLRTLQDIYVQHDDLVRRRREARLRAGKIDAQQVNGTIHYGPWMWRQVYALTRMAERVKAHNEEIYAIQHENLNPDYVRYNGLAARWVELLIRKGGEE
jgi:CRISPR-associated protein Csm1